jgi:hypothetical protein
MLDRGLTKAALKVNAMVLVLQLVDLSRHSKTKRANGLVRIDPMG